MSKVFYAATLILVGAFIPFDHSQAQTLAVKETWSSPGEPDMWFMVISGMAEAPDGSIWISDARAGTIYRIGGDGEDMSVVAGPGEGPGEVLSPSYMVRGPGNEVAVLDAVGLQIFDGEQFSERIRLTHSLSNPKGFGVLEDGRFVISAGIMGNDYSIHLFDRDGRKDHSWLPVMETDNLRAGVMLSGGPIAVTEAGDIIFSRSAPHEIIRFHTDGTQEDTIASDQDLLVFIGDDFIQEEGSGQNFVRRFEWNFPQSQGVFELEDGRVLNVVRFHDEQRSLWQLYDGQQLITQREVDRAYFPYSLADNGDILASYIRPETGEHIAVRLAVDIE